MSTSPPTPFSTLASKPPQNPSPTSSSSNTLHSTSQPTAPPDPSTAHPPLRSPSSNNYAAALADAKARAAQSPTASSLFPLSPSTTIRPATETANAGRGNTSTIGDASSSTIAMAEGESAAGVGRGVEGGKGFRPGVDRMQSWSEQDMKRAMQERLLSPGEGTEAGFSRRGEGS
ncbi:hypothetical protein MMC13_003149 [Lambiella insularis]|nr:hypothetical protein [Lambiella insularis]